MGTLPPPQRPQIFGPCLLRPNGWVDEAGTWHGVALSTGGFVLDGNPAPTPKGEAEARSPIFGPFLLLQNGWLHQDAASYGCRPQPRRLCVRWRPSPPSQKGDEARGLSAHVYRGQTVGWIKMTLGIEVGLGPVHIVLDGDTAPLPKKGTEPPIFGPSLLWPNSWMHQDATWYGGRPQPRRLC